MEPMIGADGKEYVDLGEGRGRLLRSEAESGLFECLHCGHEVGLFGGIGTRNRNHCPFCLYSKHVDSAVSGDRKAGCQGSMRPIALAFKKEGKDKEGNERTGEIMIVHECEKCGRVSINRIAGDDDPEAIMEVFHSAKRLSGKKAEILDLAGIEPLSDKDEQEALRQLFGSG